MVKEIPLTQGFVTRVDDDEFEALNRFKWRVLRQKNKYAPEKCYAYRSIYSSSRQKTEYMHRIILGDVSQVDHKDGDGLNNQRTNLRPATRSLNMANKHQLRPNKTSRFRGVHWVSGLRKWCAKIRANGSETWLGYFDDELIAAKAYDIAAERSFGEFAHLNFPPEGTVLIAD